MENFIDKMIFNPDQVSVVEFLANYFISLLSIAMPVFMFLGLVLTVFQWLISGADKRSLIENFVRYLLAISLVSLLLFTEGRKNIQLDKTTTTKSYLIIDTLNDFLVLGSRIADAFAYNFLFGFNYKNSDVPLFEFDENSFFKVKNYNTSPTPEEYVDGFFISGFLKNIIDKIEKNNRNSEAIKAKILNKYSEDINNLDKIDNKIEEFIKDINFIKTENFYKYKKYFDLELEKNIQEAIKKKQNVNIKLLLKEITNDKGLTLTEYNDIYNKTIEEIPFEYLHDFYGFRITNEELKNIIKENDLGEYVIVGKEMDIKILKFLYLINDKTRPTRYNTIINNIDLNSKYSTNFSSLPATYIYEDIKDTLKKDGLINGIKIIKDFYIDNNINIGYDIDKEINNMLNFDKMYKEMLSFFNNEPKYNIYYKLLSKDNLTFEEAKNVVDLYFSYLRYKQIKIIGHMFSPVEGFYLKEDMKVKDKMFFDRFNYFNELLENSYKSQIRDNSVNDFGIQVQTRGITIFKTNLKNSLKLSKSELEKALLRVNTINFGKNYSIGSNFLKNDNNNFIKLKYLDNGFLLKSEINNILIGKGMDINLDKYNNINNTSFHWYDLNRYAVGIKNLFLQTHTFYSNMGIYEETIKANTLITTCLPIYQQISENPKAIKTLTEDVENLCFSGNKSREYTAIDSVSKFMAAVQGAKAGYKVSKTVFKFGKFSGAFGWLGSLIIGIAGGVGYGYATYIVIYSFLLYFIFLIPTIFIFLAVLSWIFRSSMAMIFFGFSIIMYLFNKKKDRLIENFYTFLMYVIMPLFLTFIFFLIIHLSFVLSITVDNIIPNISVENYILGKNYNEVVTNLINDPNIEEKSMIKRLAEYIINITKDTVQALTGETLKLLSVMIYNWFLDIFKLLIIIILDFILYMNLWKVDKYINEIISTSVKSTEFDSQKIMSTFGGVKGLRAVTSATT